MTTPSFDEAYNNLYKGWDRNSAQADYNAGNWKNKAGADQYLNGGSTSSSTPSYSSGNNFNWGDYYNNMSKQQSDLINQQKQDETNRVTQDTNDVNNFMTDYKANTGSIYDTANKNWNIGGQTDLVNGLNSRIKTLSSNSDNAGAGGYASADQVDQAINSSYLPQYNSANENLTRSAALAQNEVNTKLAPYQVQASMLNDRLAREQTGFTQEHQNELDSLLKTLTTVGQLSSAEQDRANQLAIAEQGYQNALDKANIETKYVPYGYLGGVYNTTTGTTATGGGGGSFNLGGSELPQTGPPSYFTPG